MINGNKRISNEISEKSVKKQLNVGIQILRCILCLWVLIIHCSIIQKKHIKYFKKHFHVPTFVLLSFYFFYKSFEERVIHKIVLRFQRLLIPYILWPVFLLIINNLFLFYGSNSKFSLKSLVKDFYIQLLIGSRIHGIFWFQFNLIFLSLFFTLISFIFKKIVLQMLILVGSLSFFFHISGTSYKYLILYKGVYGMNIGCLVELCPLGVFGCILRFVDFLSNIKHFSIYSHVIILLFIAILFQYDIFTYQPGFRYPNVSLNILASTLFFTLFGSLSLEKIFNVKSILLLKIITKYTAGIYNIHPIIRNYLRKYIFIFKEGSYLIALIIYIICYFFCLIGDTAFKNNKLKYLFI